MGDKERIAELEAALQPFIKTKAHDNTWNGQRLRGEDTGRRTLNVYAEDIERAQKALQGQSDLVAVPREPTEEMIAAGIETDSYFSHPRPSSDKHWLAQIYKAMINEGR